MILVCWVAQADFEPLRFGLTQFRSVTDYVEFAGQSENSSGLILHVSRTFSETAKKSLDFFAALRLCGNSLF